MGYINAVQRYRIIWGQALSVFHGPPPKLYNFKYDKKVNSTKPYSAVPEDSLLWNGTECSMGQELIANYERIYPFTGPEAELALFSESKFLYFFESIIFRDLCICEINVLIPIQTCTLLFLQLNLYVLETSIFSNFLKSKQYLHLLMSCKFKFGFRLENVMLHFW